MGEVTPVDPWREIAARLSNWGRWGAADEKGTLNFITPTVIAHAATLARTGKVFAMAIPFDETGPQDGKIRTNPMRFMRETGHNDQGYKGVFRYADDVVFMALQSASQWDALAHVHYDGKLFNGFSIDTIDEKGAQHGAITNLSPGVVSRGVLIDVAGYKKVDWLEKGYAISPEELEEVIAHQRVEIKSGDVLLIRTGWRNRYTHDLDKAAFKAGEPGLSIRTLDWLAKNEIAAVCSDNYAVEVIPTEYPDQDLPFHLIAIRDMGMPLAEILDFETLAKDCAADGVYEFLFVGAPLPFTRGVGSPVNPIAIKQTYSVNQQNGHLGQFRNR